MVGIAHRHHVPKHAARKRQEAREQPAPAVLPERFLPLREHAERVARGQWADPALGDWIRALRREHDAWLRGQRQG
jgi:hypothetical protein